MGASVMRLHMRSGCAIRPGNRGAIVHGNSSMGSRLLRVSIRLGIGVRRHVLRPVLLAPRVIFPIAVVSASRMGHVRDHLHAARDGTSRATASRSVGGGSRAAEPFVQLLQESAANIVSRNVHSVRNAHDDERSLSGQGKARVRGIKPGA